MIKIISIVLFGMLLLGISYSIGEAKTISCVIVEVNEPIPGQRIKGNVVLECKDLGKFTPGMKVKVKTVKKKVIEGC